MTQPPDTPPAAPDQPPAAPAAGAFSDPLKLLVETGLFAGMAGAMVWIAGWSYADRFFAELGLNLAAVEGIGEDSFAAYAYWVFRDGWLPLLLAGLMLVLAGLSFAALRRPGPLPPLSVGVLLVALAAGGMVGAATLGAGRVARQVPWLLAEGYQNFPRLILVPKKDSDLAAFLAERGQLARSTCLRKLFMDRRNLYVYPGYESLRGKRPHILILPLREIQAVELVANPGLCEP